jgi:hypothetical protein
MSTTYKRKNMHGGGCGCGTSHQGPSMMGRFFSGGSACGASNPNPPSFANVPLRSFYGQANQNENPLNEQVASRLLGGGRNKKRKTQSKRKSQKKRKTHRKRRSGGMLLGSSPEFTLLNTNTMV